MNQNVSAATFYDLIVFSRVIPETRMRTSIRRSIWHVLLVALHGSLRRCVTLRELERSGRRHHRVLIETLGIEIKHPLLDSALRCFFLPVAVALMCDALRD